MSKFKIGDRVISIYSNKLYNILNVCHSDVRVNGYVGWWPESRFKLAYPPLSPTKDQAISLLTSLGYDITPPKPKLSGWVNIISNGTSARPEHGKVWATKEEADKMGTDPRYAKWETGYKRIACVPFTEGEGL